MIHFVEILIQYELDIITWINENKSIQPKLSAKKLFPMPSAIFSKTTSHLDGNDFGVKCT